MSPLPRPLAQLITPVSSTERDGGETVWGYGAHTNHLAGYVGPDQYHALEAHAALQRETSQDCGADGESHAV